MTALLLRTVLATLLALASASANAADRVTLQLKWHHQFQFAGYYAAKALGYYEEAGLDVEIRPVRLDQDPLEAVIGGRAEFGIASTDLLLKREAGHPVVVLASIFQHSPYVLLAMRRNGIETVHDLVDKTVLIDPFATEIVAYLKAMKVPLDRVRLVQANDYSYESLLNGRADAYAGYSTNDPFYLERAGASFLSFVPRSAGIDFYGDNLFTTRSQIDRFPDRVEAFRKASLRGWRFAVENPDKVIDLMIERGWGTEANREKLRFEAEKIIQIIRPDLVEIGYAHEARWQHVVNTYADLGMLPRDMSLEGFLYGKTPPGLPIWALWSLGSFLTIALLSAGVAVYVHRANKRLEFQIDQRERAENAELKLAGAVYQSLGDALLVTDDNGRIVSVNPALSKMIGQPPQSLIGRGSETLIEAAERVTLMRSIGLGLEAADQWSGLVPILQPDGSSTKRHLFVRAIRGESGALIRTCCIFSSMDEGVSEGDTIWDSLHLDPVTSLPNRRLFAQSVQAEIERHRERRASNPLPLLLLDIDRFKEVNDALGHDMGDLVLAETARRLRRCVGDRAPVGRLDGDKFGILLADCEQPSAVETAVQAVLTAMATPFNAPQLPFYLSASVGIAQFPKDSESVDRLLQLAEQAMFFAKETGRNRRVYFSASMQEAATERARLTNDLRNALEFQELHLEYQPIVALDTGRIVKAEALMRWRHPVEGLISPVKFIPLAERSGLIVPMGRWAFREACRQLALWRRAHDLKLSINMSPVEIQSEADPSIEIDFLRSIGLSGDAIAVEITESTLVDTTGPAGERLAGLRRAGIALSLDDFGTGYSSLAYLQKMDVGFLKIDRAFVRDLEENPSNRALCSAMISMAHGLGIQVIAEGIETPGQARILLGLGCDYGQGFHFGRPLPAQAFLSVLEASGDDRSRSG